MAAQVDFEVDVRREKAERIAADADLQAQIDAGGGGGGLTAETAARIAADNAEAAARAAADTAEASARSTADSSEASARAAADTALDGRLDTLEADPTTGTALAAEATARAAADTSEATARAAADTSEASTRAAADTALSTSISSEASTRASADTALSTSISSEASTRASADSTESAARIAADSSEASTRASADTAEATARAAADALLQPLADKNGASGYLGLDAGRAVPNTNYLTPERRFALAQKVLSKFLANAANAGITEVWIGDSMGHTGASAPETTSMLAIYEAEMARAWNRMPRTVGYVPVDLWTTAAGTEMSWDSVPSGHSDKGPSFSNKPIDSTHTPATITRTGTAVRIWWTAFKTNGALLDVTINGVAQTQINTTVGSIAGSFESGHSTLYNNPAGATVSGPMTVTVAYSSGTTGELEGATFYNLNAPGSANQRGHNVIRATRSGQSITDVIDPTKPYVLDVVSVAQPQIVTIVLGVNDVQVYNASASTLATNLGTLIDDIRAKYATFTPTIRYVFQWDWTFAGTFPCPADWATTYRSALRLTCITKGILFLDAEDATGGLAAASGIGLSADGLHPGDAGHSLYGQLVASVSTKASNTRLSPLDLSNTSRQPVAATNGIVRLISTNALGTNLYIGIDTGVAVVNGTVVSTFGFMGATDAFGTLQAVAGIEAVAEETYALASYKTGLRFVVIPTAGGAPSVFVTAGGFSGASDFFVGTTLAASKFTVDVNGAVLAAVLQVSGLTGATSTGRYVGVTAATAPSTGTFAVGDWVVTRTGRFFVCTAAGSPGTWTESTSLMLPLTGGTLTGALTLGADSSAASHKITSLAAGTTAGDAMRYEQTVQPITESAAQASHPGGDNVEHELRALAIPAGKLRADGDSLEGFFSGTFAANAHHHEVLLYLGGTGGTGGTLIADTGDLVTNGATWLLEFYAIRVSSTSVKTITRFHLVGPNSAPAIVPIIPQHTTVTVTVANAFDLSLRSKVVSGTSSAGDQTAEMAKVRYVPA